MQHPLGGSVALSRELDFNSRMRPRDVPGKAYACGLEKSLELREPYGSETGSLTHFARDEVTGGYVMGTVKAFRRGKVCVLMRELSFRVQPRRVWIVTVRARLSRILASLSSSNTELL